MSYDGYTKYDERVARAYDADRQSEEHWRAEHAYVEQRARARRLGRVLDLPVGTGRFLELLVGAESVIGVDISADMLSVAEERRRSLQMSNTLIVRGDGLGLPFPDGFFDTVLCFRLIHLLPPALVPRLLSELARVSAGEVLVQVYAAPERRPGWYESPLVRPLLAILRRLRRSRPRPWSHIQSYPHSADFLEKSAAAAGLRLLRRVHLTDYAGSAVDVLELGK